MIDGGGGVHGSRGGGGSLDSKDSPLLIQQQKNGCGLVKSGCVGKLEPSLVGSTSACGSTRTCLPW